MRDQRASGPSPIGLSGSRTFFPELDSLRGIALLLVFFAHADVYLREGADSGTRDVAFFGAVILNGHTAVDIFFVLSAFLLSLPFIHSIRTRQPLSTKEYFIRRALRILPLYWVAVVVATVLTSRVPADLVRGLPYLAFLNASGGWVTPMAPYSLVWWSIATEVQFYLLLPLSAFLFRSRRGRWLGVLLLGAYAFAYQHGAWETSLADRGPTFLCGVGAAILYDRWGARLRERAADGRWMGNGLADVALLVLLAAIALLLQSLVSFRARVVVDAVGWAAVLLILIIAPLRAKVLLSNPLFARIGVISYSFFLIHMPLLYFGLGRMWAVWPRAHSGWSPGGVAAVVTLGLVTVALSELTFRSIERPFLARKDRSAGGGELTSTFWRLALAACLLLALPRAAPTRFVPEIRDTRAARQTHDLLAFELVPAASIRFLGRPLHVNGWGMRDREYSREKPPGTYRIALVGDAFVMGAGVGDDETFENRLEDRLNASHPDRRYEILNFAVGGYSALEHLVTVERKVLDFAPDALFYVANGDEAAATVFHLVRAARRGTTESEPFLAGLLLHPDVDPQSLLTSIYRRIAKQCWARGVLPVWIFLPTGPEDLPLGRTARANGAGFAVIDLSGKFAGKVDDQLVADRLYAEIERRPYIGRPVLPRPTHQSLAAR